MRKVLLSLSPPLQTSGTDTQGLTSVHAETGSILSELRTPFSLVRAPTYHPLPSIIYIVKSLRGSRDLSAAVKRDDDADRCGAGSRIPRVREGGRARGRNAPIAFHGPLRGSHVRRGGSGDVGVASGAYVTCAVRRDAAVLVEANGTVYSHRGMREYLQSAKSERSRIIRAGSETTG